MILVRINKFSFSTLGFVLLLEDVRKIYKLPIFIGLSEAQAIIFQFNKLQSPRPLTHDLLENILKLLNCKISYVVIDNIIDNTFYAKISLENQNDKFQIDARPSDAIALALRFNVPIYVTKNVMENSAIKNKDQNKKKNNQVEILQKKLQSAIEEERYEDAAYFRDEINNITK